MHVRMKHTSFNRRVMHTLTSRPHEAIPNRATNDLEFEFASLFRSSNSQNYLMDCTRSKISTIYHQISVEMVRWLAVAFSPLHSGRN